MSVEIKECYKQSPRVDCRKAVERLLSGIPQRNLRGLKTVVLRDTESLSHNRKRKKNMEPEKEGSYKEGHWSLS